MSSSYIERLSKETEVYKQNFVGYKERLAKILSVTSHATQEDKLALHFDDASLNLSYEMLVITETLLAFLPVFEGITKKHTEEDEDNHHNSEDMR